ncbi:hypothetical protein FACS1894205_0160 [Alphaproteobacteria bacterium]|nr:hypothetical protein FACS1894205_0160 [Alphaproteobacteria bacterium]
MASLATKPDGMSGIQVERLKRKREREKRRETEYAEPRSFGPDRTHSPRKDTITGNAPKTDAH